MHSTMEDMDIRTAAARMDIPMAATHIRIPIPTIITTTWKMIM
jgi:hypothetical protein